MLVCYIALPRFMFQSCWCLQHANWLDNSITVLVLKVNLTCRPRSPNLFVLKIQSIVREIAPQKYGVGQLPVTISTFTNERKLYLSPGVNMRTTHPESLRKPVLPNPRKTEIEYKGEWLNLTFLSTYIVVTRNRCTCFFAVFWFPIKHFLTLFSPHSAIKWYPVMHSFDWIM